MEKAVADLGALYIDQVGFELRDPSVSAFRVLAVCITTPSSLPCFLFYYFILIKGLLLNLEHTHSAR